MTRSISDDDGAPPFVPASTLKMLMSGVHIATAEERMAEDVTRIERALAVIERARAGA